MLESLGITTANEPLNFHIYAEEEAVEYVENELQKLELDQFHSY